MDESDRPQPTSGASGRQCFASQRLRLVHTSGSNSALLSPRPISLPQAGREDRLPVRFTSLGTDPRDVPGSSEGQLLTDDPIGDIEFLSYLTQLVSGRASNDYRKHPRGPVRAILPLVRGSTLDHRVANA